jgi:hypothetical protein
MGAGITCNGPIIANSLELLTTPLGITSGGTGGDTAAAAWTALGGGGTIASPTFTTLTASGSINSNFYAPIASFTPTYLGGSSSSIAALKVLQGTGGYAKISDVESFQWSSTGNLDSASDLSLGRDAPATLQIGIDHASIPTAQTIKAHDVTTGTGASLRLAGGKGSSVGGAVIISTSTTNEPPVARLTVGADGATTLSTPLAITSGGTGGSTADAARTALGLGGSDPVTFGVISTSSQPIRIPLMYSNEADFLTLSTAFVDVTGLSFPVLANKNYAVTYWLVTNKNDATGLQFRFTGPASPTKVFLRHVLSSSAVSSGYTEVLTSLSTASSTFNSYSGDGFAATALGGLISNGANAGTVQLQLRAITGGIAKIYAGSWIQVTQLN